MMNKVKRDIFSKFYLGCFFLILTLPLLAIPPLFHPPAWGKVIIFRMLISLMSFIFVWELIFHREEFSSRRKKNSLGLWLLITLGTISLLSTFFSLNPFFSFWGSPYRAGGSLNFSFFLVFTILALFLLKDKDWQNLWKFSFMIGILVSLIALFQYFHLFSSELLISYEKNPPSTFGNSMFLAIYLLLIIFLVLSFALIEKRVFWKVLYFFTILFFFFIILISETRAAYLGIFLGFFYFFFFFPFKMREEKKLKVIKFFILIFLIILLGSIYYLNTLPELPKFFQENRILADITSRLSLQLLFQESRFAAWKVVWQAIVEKPIFGWGPENFSIAFDRYYDPSLPQFANITWWDRAHNFVFDIGVTTGIPALLIYLAIFGILFWQLQILKKKNIFLNQNKTLLLAHGIQATFIAYLSASFFSFDAFSTYLISFFLIGHSLSLISPKDLKVKEKSEQKSQKKFSQIQTSPLIFCFKRTFIIFFFFLLVWFLWSFNLEPLFFNKEINWALYYAENQKCEKAFARMEKILSSQSILNHYLRLRYLDIINICIQEMPQKKIELAQKAILLLQEAIKIRPYYTRSWILLGSYTTILMENKKNLNTEEFSQLKENANYYFQKASKLAPKREEIYLGWTQANLLGKEYQKAKETAEKCLALNPEFLECQWQKVLSLIYLGKTKEAQKEIEELSLKGYVVDNKKSLLQLIKAYIYLAEKTGDLKYYQALAELYQRLIEIDYHNFQWHASLAYVYKILRNYKKAREEALIVLKLSPESKQNVEEFLKTLPPP